MLHLLRTKSTKITKIMLYHNFKHKIFMTIYKSNKFKINNL